MNNEHAIQHKLRNQLQTVLMIVGMSLLLALSARLLFGPELWLWLMAGFAVIMLGLPSASPAWLLRMYRARGLNDWESPRLHALVSELARRAGLPVRPRLFMLPGSAMNAFAFGSRERPAIALTEGLFQALSWREISGVLAHEISHIRNNDLHIMTLADMLTRFTHILSTTALLILLLLTPFVLLGNIDVSISGLLILVVTPAISALMQLGLSRLREFDADLDAARLTGDPAGLASALARIEQHTNNPWRGFLVSGAARQLPSVLRSHPATTERIRRLLSLQAPPRQGVQRQVIRTPYRLDSRLI
jgi:heat shock protein HtpX